MSENPFVGGVGVLTIKGDGGVKEFKIRPIGVQDESAMMNTLAKIGSAIGQGQAYELIKPLLDKMAPIDRAAAVQQLVAQESDIYTLASRARGVPDGVATELYYRAYRQMPELTLSECKAAVNEANVVEVSSRLYEIIRSEKEPGKS